MFRYAAVTIAKSTTMVTKQHGGKRLALTRPPPPELFGCRHIHFRPGQRKRAATARALKQLPFLVALSQSPLRVKITKRTQIPLRFPNDLV